MNSDKFIISMIVHNEAGVLTRVSGLFGRRGFNIDSLSVGETEEKGFSRITITAKGDDYVKDQIVKQIEKLHDVTIIELMDKEKTVLRELLLIKVQATPDRRSEIFEAVSVFRAKVVDLSPFSMTVEITGETAKLDAFIEYVEPFGITELCRTGVTAIGRGEYVLKNTINSNNTNNNEEEN